MRATGEVFLHPNRFTENSSPLVDDPAHDCSPPVKEPAPLCASVCIPRSGFGVDGIADQGMDVGGGGVMIGRAKSAAVIRT